MCTSVEIEKRRKLEESILKYLEACPRAAHSDALRGHDIVLCFRGQIDSARSLNVSRWTMKYISG